MANNTDDANVFDIQVTRPNHGNKMTATFETMLIEESFCDISICCGGDVIKAHRVVLAASSAYFRQILSGVNNTQYPIVFLNGIEPIDLQKILSFMYTGDIRIPKGQLPSLIKCAEILGVSGLAQLDPQNPGMQESLTSTVSADRTSSPAESLGGQAKRGRKRKKTTNKAEEVGSDSDANQKKPQTDNEESEDMEVEGSKGIDEKLPKSKLRSWSQQITTAFKANHKDQEEFSESESHSLEEERVQSLQESDGTGSQTKKENLRQSRSRKPPQKYNDFTLPKGIQEGRDDSVKASDTETEGESPSIRPPPRLTRGRSRVHSNDDAKSQTKEEPPELLQIASTNPVDASDTSVTLTPNTRSRRQTHSPSETPKLAPSPQIKPNESETKTPSIEKIEEDGSSQGSSGGNRIKSPVKSQTPMTVPTTSTEMLKWRPKDTNVAAKFIASRVSTGTTAEYKYESVQDNGPPVYRCKECNHSFRSKQNVNDHIRNVHNNSDQRYCCPLCMKAFKWKTSLNNHMNTNHPNSRPAPMRVFSKKSLP